MPRREPQSELPRLSRKERLILDLLATEGDSYGLQLVDASQGQLKRGTVYVTLGRMEAKELVESFAEEPERARSGTPRRIYRPTARGRRALHAVEVAEALWAGAEGEAS